MFKDSVTTKKKNFTTYRYLMIGLAAALLLPPLSFLFQLTGDHNFCGTWCPRMFMVWRENMSISQYFVGYLRSYMGVVLMVSVLITTFFIGRYWCSHLCPIGGTMELGSKLVPRFLKIDFSNIPAPSFRYGYLTVYFGAAALGIGSLCCNYCHFATVPRIFGAFFSDADLSYFLRISGLVNLGLVVLLGLMAKGGRAYCNLMCPIGALDALSNRFGMRFGKRMRLDASRCNECKKCADVCPVWAIDVKTDMRIDPFSCIPCGKCVDVCGQKAIKYGKSDDFAVNIKTEVLHETNQT
jgi:ferredoxin-type protein NapH